MLVININREEKRNINLINRIIQKIKGEIDVIKVLEMIKNDFKIFNKEERNCLLEKVIQTLIINQINKEAGVETKVSSNNNKK
jgi:hypothetical protein